MQAKYESIKNALLECGKEHFLKYGFEKASLRDICTDAGVTTGAVYSYFEKKEDLFSALVDKSISEFETLFKDIFEYELWGRLSAIDSELRSAEFITKYRDEIRLLFDCWKGTKYEDPKQKYIDDVLLKFYQYYFNHYAKTSVDPDLVRLIMNFKFQAYMELVYGEYTKDKASGLIAATTPFFEGGFKAVIAALNEEDKGKQ